MKVIFAIKNLVSAAGGAERVLCSVCSDLINRGHEVSLLTFNRPGGQPFYPLDLHVKRIDLGIGDASCPAKIGETLLRMRALRQVILRERPDLAVGFMHSIYVPMGLALIGTGVPVLGSEHIVPAHYRTRQCQYLLMILAAPFIKKITVLSDAVRSSYASILKKRMVIMPNPVEPTKNLANVGINKESFTLLSVGRLDVQKDHRTLLQAFARLTNKFPRWCLKIYGEGPLRSALERLVKALGLEEKVSMPGVVTEITAQYEAADIFVISSRYEAFGLVTAEAMSHGLPVVGFADCPGTNELIKTGRTGILVQPDNDRVTSLATALSSLMADPLLRQQLGITGHNAIRNQFSPKVVYDRWEDLLHSTRESA